MLSNNITILIVTYKSERIIDETLKNLKDFKIIVIENSKNFLFKEYLENKYKNVNCILTGSNLGYGAALNIGLKNFNSKYFLILNPDSLVESGVINKIYSEIEKNPSIAVISPSTLNKKNQIIKNHGYSLFSKTKKDYLNEVLLSVDFVIGHMFLIRSSILDSVGKFDENFLLNYEEIDLFTRVKKTGKYICIHKNCFTKHLDGKSTLGNKNSEMPNHEVTLTLKWHFSWGMFYFYKKNYNVLLALIICNFFLLKCFVKFFYFFLINDKKKKEIITFFIKGMFNSFLGKKSFYRPKI